MEKIKLPNLSVGDMEKLDLLLSFMKESKTEFIDIYKVCKKKWGENRLLYLFFAEYLKNNSFTLVENHNKGQEYVWRQMIAPRGLDLDGFKKEYNRQRKKKKATEKSANQSKGFSDLARATFLITSLFISFLCSGYLFKTDNKIQAFKQQALSADTLQLKSQKIMTDNKTVSDRIKKDF